MPCNVQGARFDGLGVRGRSMIKLKTESQGRRSFRVGLELGLLRAHSYPQSKNLDRVRT